MEKNNIDMYMMANGDKLPSEKVFIIEEALIKCFVRDLRAPGMRVKILVL